MYPSRYLLIAIVSALGCAYAGNFSHIQDPDGYVNVRVTPSRQAEIFQTIKNGLCVELFGSVDGWTHIAYQDEDAVVTGYVRTSRLIDDPDCDTKGVEARYGKCAVASLRAEELQNFADLRVWHTQYATCGKSDMLATVSDFLVSYLAKDWNQAMQELKDMKPDAALQDFILAQLAEASSMHDLEKIMAATNRCEASMPLCASVKTAAEKALGR